MGREGDQRITPEPAWFDTRSRVARDRVNGDPVAPQGSGRPRPASFSTSHHLFRGCFILLQMHGEDQMQKALNVWMDEEKEAGRGTRWLLALVTRSGFEARVTETRTVP